MVAKSIDGERGKIPAQKEDRFAEKQWPHYWKRQFCSNSEVWPQNDLSSPSYLIEN